MLSADPASRFSVQDCLSDPWIASHHPSIPNKVLDQTMKQLRSNKKTSPVKAAIVSFLVTRVMKGSELAAYAEIFMSLDTDGNGTLTPEELRIGLERLMPPASAAAEVKRITATQPSASKTISYNQYLLSAVDPKILLSQENLRTAFAYIDSDRSGMISSNELKTKLFGNSTQSEALWKELSRSSVLRDDVITFREFEEIIKGAC
jgi:calcium-dependent protein kinase